MALNELLNLSEKGTSKLKILQIKNLQSDVTNFLVDMGAEYGW